MTKQEAIERASRAISDGNREAADYYIMLAQDDPDITELERGAARIRQIAGVVFWLAVLFFIVLLVEVFGL